MAGTDISGWMSGDGMSHWYRDNNRWYMLIASAVITAGAIGNYMDDASDIVLWSYISILAVVSFVLALFMAGNTGVLPGGIVLPLSFVERIAGRERFLPFGSIEECTHRTGGNMQKLEVTTRGGAGHLLFLGEGPEAGAAAAYVMARVEVKDREKD